jgi:hypothetical protein
MNERNDHRGLSKLLVVPPQRRMAQFVLQEDVDGLVDSLPNGR